MSYPRPHCGPYSMGSVFRFHSSVDLYKRIACSIQTKKYKDRNPKCLLPLPVCPLFILSNKLSLRWLCPSDCRSTDIKKPYSGRVVNVDLHACAPNFPSCSSLRYRYSDYSAHDSTWSLYKFSCYKGRDRQAEKHHHGGCVDDWRQQTRSVAEEIVQFAQGDVNQWRHCSSTCYPPGGCHLTCSKRE